MRLGDFSAGIFVDGVELEEYDITIEPPPLSPPHLNTAEKKTTCWIASAENKKFTIQWKCHSETRELAYSGRIYVDGVRCKSNIMLRGRLGQHDTIRRTSISDSRVRRDLMFSRVEDTGGDVSLDTGTPLVDDDDAGEIVIKIVAGCVGKSRVSTKTSESLCSDARTVKVREGSEAKDTAAAVHCISLAEAVPRTTVATTREFTSNKQPPIVFVFKYRPLEVLQACGIAPPTLTRRPAEDAEMCEDWRNDIEMRDGTPSPIQSQSQSQARSRAHSEAHILAAENQPSISVAGMIPGSQVMPSPSPLQSIRTMDIQPIGKLVRFTELNEQPVNEAGLKRSRATKDEDANENGNDDAERRSKRVKTGIKRVGSAGPVVVLERPSVTMQVFMLSEGEDMDLS